MKNSKIEFRLESILSPTAGRRGMTTVQILTAVAVAAIALPTFASLHASARARQADPDKQERTVALSNIKQAALATLMYVNDYDDAYPYVQQTASAVAVLQPYSKNLEIFRSPTKGGKFLFNMNLAGVFSTSIEEPAMTPMWIEWLPDPKLRVAVAFSDGHAKLVSTGALGDPRVKPEVAYDANHREFPGGPAPLKAYLTKRFPRAKTMHPLPADYLLPRRP